MLIRMRLGSGLIVSAMVLSALGIAAAQESDGERVVVLRGLDKVTARISQIEAPIDRPVRFGTLKIQARFCKKRPPEETPETTAFLDIVDVKPGEAPLPLFSGWMFASSPALSALEHPVYYVWVIDCKISRPESPPGSE